VLLSGLGGYMSDRFSKQYVIIGSKVAEIVIMAIAFVVLLIPGLSADAQLMWLISVLFLMGGQSAIFGPSKYGILPELFRADKLLPVNGAVQMTTFLAIIFGTVCAGMALDSIREFLWVGSVIAVGIAIAGTVSSLLVPRTRVAEPNLKMRVENLAIPADVARLVFRERGLLKAVLVAAVFWFLGGVTQMAVNTLGKSTMGLSATRTSLLVAAIGFGIAAGCAMTGLFGGKGNGSRWVTSGAWLLFVSLSLIGFLGSGQLGIPASSGAQGEAMLTGILHADLLEWSLRFSMTLLGFAAGMFVVPVQVYLQQAPPAELKGRLLGVQNLVTWIGILFSAAYFAICGVVLNRFGGQNGESRYQWIVFLSLAALMLPICFFYRLPKVDVDKTSESR
jgi:MFS family permease